VVLGSNESQKLGRFRQARKLQIFERRFFKPISDGKARAGLPLLRKVPRSISIPVPDSDWRAEKEGITIFFQFKFIEPFFDPRKDAALEKHMTQKRWNAVTDGQLPE